MGSYHESSSNDSISEEYSETAQALIIVEGVCGGLGSLLILITLFHLIFFEKLKTTYLLVQSQVSTYSLITGQYSKKVDPMPSFLKLYLKVNNSKFHPFLRASEVLEGLRSQENLISQSAKMKV